MPYDHHRKAGNQGDCVKHPALIAALDAVLKSQANHDYLDLFSEYRPIVLPQLASPKLFHYMDVFAGHAWHPLLDGKEFKWRDGIGRLASAKLPDKASDCVKTWWSLWHAAPEWPTMTPAGYPGSAWIAAHRFREANRPVKLELYDRSEEVRRDLERAFPPSHAIQDAGRNICLIGQSLDPTEEKEEHVTAADFVFIDPPGWKTKKHPEYPKWEDIFEHVLKPRAKGKPTLMWMPTAGNDCAFDGRDPSEKIKKAADADYGWTAARWQTAGAEACVLVYNCASDEIRKAIEFMARAMKWGQGEKSFEPLKHSESD